MNLRKAGLWITAIGGVMFLYAIAIGGDHSLNSPYAGSALGFGLSGLVVVVMSAIFG